MERQRLFTMVGVDARVRRGGIGAEVFARDGQTEWGVLDGLALHRWPAWQLRPEPNGRGTARTRHLRPGFPGLLLAFGLLGNNDFGIQGLPSLRAHNMDRADVDHGDWQGAAPVGSLIRRVGSGCALGIIDPGTRG